MIKIASFSPNRDALSPKKGHPLLGERSIKLNGIILINKEKGCTSHDVVYKVKKLTNSKVGHTGTLDPNSTGVLPL